MYKLITPFYAYNKQYRRNFLIMYTNMAGEMIDENKVVHNENALAPARDNLRPPIKKALLI
jgi:hypothetical protein